jgi:hypothetical protein
MKSKYIYISMLLGALTMTSCEDFLEKENTTSLNQETFFDSDEAIESATAPLYNYVWNDFNGKFYYSMGDGRANNITAQYSDYIYPYTNMNETSLSAGLDDAWKSLYSVVAQANNTINNIKDYATSSVSEDAKNQGIAEARFMRGTAYWYLASLWGAAIIYDNTADLVNNYVVPANNRTDVIEFAIRDLEYAAKYLPKTASTVGRVTQTSAFGMLSRVYLSMAGLTTDGEYNGSNVATDFNRGTRNTYYLDLARKAALKVIGNNSYGLLDNYGDLFKIESNNNKESLFSLQWLTGSTDAIGWGCNQSIAAFFGWSTLVTDGTNWGGATYCSWNLFQEYDAQDKIRKHYSVASYGEYYEDMNIKNGGYTYGVTESRGNQGANIKKYVVGTHDDNGVSYKQSTGMNTYMQRVAEVYLNLAEAILGNDASTSDATALEYFNKVRTRAGMPTKKSISYEDLRYERRIEFAFEGQYWYDLVRRAYYKQQEVVNYLNNQDRNASYDYDETTGVYEISASYVAPGTGVATATVGSLTLPVSDNDQNKNSYLKADANGELQTVAYEFGDKEVTASELYN